MEEPKRPADLANCVYRLEILLLQVRVMVVNMHYHPVCEFDAGYVRSNTYQRVSRAKTAVGYFVDINSIRNIAMGV